MKDGDQFQAVAADSIRDDVQGIGNHKLPRPKDAPWPTHLWLASKQINALQNSRCYGCRALWTVFGETVANREKVPDSSPGPNDHRGALASAGLPHDLSHFETFS
jgi:hypothetical protein